jgi:hypothetical protein
MNAAAFALLCRAANRLDVMNNGSFDNFHVWWRCGANPNARQIRDTAFGATRPSTRPRQRSKP